MALREFFPTGRQRQADMPVHRDPDRRDPVPPDALVPRKRKGAGPVAVQSTAPAASHGNLFYLAAGIHAAALISAAPFFWHPPAWVGLLGQGRGDIK